MKRKLIAGATSIAAACLVVSVHAEDSAVMITATRTPEPAISVPVAQSLIDGDEARKRGAFDLRTAVAAAAGVEVSPGGDMGPAGGVVALQGLAEMDAYLLVVDGVPYGGAFNPATATLDLIDFNRIEVLRGAAPVTYGATSFVGVMQILNHSAGEQPTRVQLQSGTLRGSRVAFAANLPPMGTIKQSLLASAETRKFTQDRGKFDRVHFLYRAAVESGIGIVRFDVDGTTLDQTPYSPHPREGIVLSARIPLDANANPADARQDQDRIQGNLVLDARIGALDWTTTGSLATTHGRTTRGFLRDGFATDGFTVNADGFRQQVRTTDGYLDTHVGRRSAHFDWIAGGDLLYGTGQQRSANFEYAVRADGVQAPNSSALATDETTMLTDRRRFTGGYVQGIVRPNNLLTLLAGIRLNHTRERRCGGALEGAAPAAIEDCTSRYRTRLAGSLGATLALWQKGADAVAAFADYRNTYKPAAIDFGPEAEADILEPETSRSAEGGLKALLLDKRLTLEASVFDTRFRNLVIRENIGGLPALASAGAELFRGFEVEAAYRVRPSFSVAASYAHHSARFTDYARLRADGSIQQLAGKRLELSPADLASAVVAYTPSKGLQASATLRFVGSRFLNKANTSVAGDYVTLDGRLGWRLGERWGAFIDAQNLTNRRDPVTESELGDAQFYRLPGRRVLLSFSYEI